MTESDLAADVAELLETDPESFDEQVAADAEVILREIDEGTFDNPQGITGLEYEFYAVTEDEAADRWREPEGSAGSLARVPRRLLEYVGFEKELGLHNAEISTSPQPLNRYGLRAQEAEVCARLDAAGAPMRTEGLRLVSDGIWTIPPAGETAREYLTDSVETGGVRVATNMSDSLRYHAMSNTEAGVTMHLEAPHVTLDSATVLPESLITSIQPHYQVPHARDLPGVFRYALRVAGPLLALGVNSPFFPPDLYDEDATAEAILDDGWDENRIAVFESVLDVVEGEPKVTFPHDVDTVEEAVDRVVADETVVPMPVSRGDRFDDSFAHFRRKHGTFWRWVRPVFDGATRSGANARIEFRPLPGQPTVRDAVAFQAVYCGLLSALPRHDHPVRTLDWETARENFYAAARDGLDAELTWITTDGVETTDSGTLYGDLLDHAEVGLEAHGLRSEEVDRYLAPLRERALRGLTPASWRRDRVRDGLADGNSFAVAVQNAQREYVERQAETLFEGTFTDWL